MKVCGIMDGDRHKEGAKINKSLCALTNVIMKLNKKESYISYRDSKLTKILQPILSGNCKSNVICTINCHDEHYSESINTIRFGISAGGIKLPFKEVFVEHETSLRLEDVAKMEELLETNDLQEKEIYYLKNKLQVKEIDLKDKIGKLGILLKEKKSLDDRVVDLTTRLDAVSESNAELQNNLKFLSERKTKEVVDQYQESYDSLNSQMVVVQNKLKNLNGHVVAKGLARKDYNRLGEDNDMLTSENPFSVTNRLATAKKVENFDFEGKKSNPNARPIEFFNTNEKKILGIVGEENKSSGGNKMMEEVSQISSIHADEGLQFDNFSRASLGGFSGLNNSKTVVKQDSVYHDKMKNFFDHFGYGKPGSWPIMDNSLASQAPSRAVYKKLGSLRPTNPAELGAKSDFTFNAENLVSKSQKIGPQVTSKAITLMEEELDLGFQETANSNPCVKSVKDLEELERLNRLNQRILDLERENVVLKERIDIKDRKMGRLENDL